MIKLNLGCGWRNFGSNWIHVDGGDYEHLDVKTNELEKLPFEDNYADLIYSSHVIAYFDRGKILEILTEWKRVLKPGGILRLATPDFHSIITLYLHKNMSLDSFLGPLYGKMDMGNEKIYHKTTYDFKSIKNILECCGFSDVKIYDWRITDHSNFDDHSQAYIPHMDKENGTLISLNVECTK